MAVLLIICAGIAVLVGLFFWGANRWSSPERDRQKTAAMRSGQQANPTTAKRGAGINQARAARNLLGTTQRTDADSRSARHSRSVRPAVPSQTCDAVAR
jgi:hypothetical protein